MAVPVSTWDSAVAALLTAINAQPAVTTAGSNILVLEGPPGPNQPDDIIEVGGIIEQRANPIAMVGSGQAHWLEEFYRIAVRIEVFRGGDDAAGTRARCKALADAVDTAVRNDPSLGGVVLSAYPLEHKFTADWEANGKGRIMACEMFIQCEAQL